MAEAHGEGRCVYYQAYFRTQRGGVGIPYGTSLVELRRALGPRAALRKEWPGRFRIAFDWLGREGELAALASRLGYTQAVLRVEAESASGAPAEFRMGARWPRGGRIREGDLDLTLAELWVADEESRLARSPHRREFAFASNSAPPRGGPRLNRRLSPLDARALANVSGLPDGARVLDPFAGLGGIVDACERRELRAVGSDADPALAPGLAGNLPGRVLLGDARALPFPDAAMDGVITEPPYHRGDRAAVTDAIPELLRVTRAGGTIALLIADFMEPALPCPPGCHEELRLVVPRHGITSLALVWRLDYGERDASGQESAGQSENAPPTR